MLSPRIVILVGAWLVVACAGPSLASDDHGPSRGLDTALFKTSAHSRLANAASRAGLDITRLDLQPDSGEIRSGDSLSALVTLVEPKQTRQWIVGLKVGALDAREGELPPPLVIHSMAGTAMAFPANEAIVNVRTVGPLRVAGGPAEDPLDVLVDAQAVVNREYLALGFHRACQTMLRLKTARADGRIQENERYSFSPSPYSADEIAIGRSIVQRAGLTFEDERAFAATFPALMTYVQLVTQTEGLSDIFNAVVEKPSLWGILRTFGRVSWNIEFHSKAVEPLDPVVLDLPPRMSVHQLPFTLMLNGKPALDCTLVVAPPVPPLLTSAGVFGLMANRPKSDSRRLVIRLIAARRG